MNRVSFFAVRAAQKGPVTFRVGRLFLPALGTVFSAASEEKQLETGAGGKGHMLRWFGGSLLMRKGLESKQSKVHVENGVAS